MRGWAGSAGSKGHSKRRRGLDKNQDKRKKELSRQSAGSSGPGPGDGEVDVSNHGSVGAARPRQGTRNGRERGRLGEFSLRTIGGIG